jgi:membrane protein DedA with SNARE-associated domain
LNLPLFALASIIGRGARFFLVAGLIVLGGDKFETTLRHYIERIGWVTVGLVIAVIVWLTGRG